MSMQLATAFWEKPNRGYTVIKSDVDYEIRLSATVKLVGKDGREFKRTYTGTLYHDDELRVWIFTVGPIDGEQLPFALRSHSHEWVYRRFRAIIDKMARQWVRGLKGIYGNDYFLNPQPEDW